MSVSAQVLAEILSEIDPSWTLHGIRALSRRASVIDATKPRGSAERLILLTHSQADRERNPHIARQEYRLLKTLSDAPLPVPQALYLCKSHQPPFLITRFVEGSAGHSAGRGRAFPQRLAAILRRIHAVDRRRFDLSFLPKLDDRTAMDSSPSAPGRRRIQAAMRRALPRLKFNAPALLHGDFWPGNLLWQDGELAGVIDWEDAMLGDPLADLGKSRLEILWALGPVAMEAYTAHYLGLNQGLDATTLPFWDLWGAFRLAHFASFALDAQAAAKMEGQYQAFVTDAIRRLDSG